MHIKIGDGTDTNLARGRNPNNIRGVVVEGGAKISHAFLFFSFDYT